MNEDTTYIVHDNTLIMSDGFGRSFSAKLDVIQMTIVIFVAIPDNGSRENRIGGQYLDVIDAEYALRKTNAGTELRVTMR